MSVPPHLSKFIMSWLLPRSFLRNSNYSLLFSEFMNSSILNSSDCYFRHLGNFLENAVGDNSHWLWCWRATLHGWNVGQFHSRCDGKNDTVTIIRKGKFIFGGYTDIPWGKKKLIPLFYPLFLLQCNSFTILIYLHCLLEFKGELRDKNELI